MIHECIKAAIPRRSTSLLHPAVPPSRLNVSSPQRLIAPPHDQVLKQRPSVSVWLLSKIYRSCSAAPTTT